MWSVLDRQDMSSRLRMESWTSRLALHTPLLDEPTTGLDPQSRARLWDEMHRLRENGTTVFLTTHYKAWFCTLLGHLTHKLIYELAICLATSRFRGQRHNRLKFFAVLRDEIGDEYS